MKVRNDIAEAAERLSPLLCDSTSRVPTMFSFANIPETTATDISPLPKPSGAKNGAMKLPIPPRRLTSNESATENLPPETEKYDKNQTATDERRITDPAFFMNDRLCLAADFVISPSLGIIYEGSSMMKSELLPPKMLPPLRRTPERRTAAKAKMYARMIVNFELPSIVDETKAITVSFALHGMKGVTMMLALRWLSFSIVLVDSRAGTLQPEPIISGIKVLPERLAHLNILSVKKAILAIYPLSSRKPSDKNSMKICGKKLRTEPTAENIPSRTRSCIHKAQPMLFKNDEVCELMQLLIDKLSTIVLTAEPDNVTQT